MTEYYLITYPSPKDIINQLIAADWEDRYGEYSVHNPQKASQNPRDLLTSESYDLISIAPESIRRVTGNSIGRIVIKGVTNDKLPAIVDIDPLKNLGYCGLVLVGRQPNERLVYEVN